MAPREEEMKRLLALVFLLAATTAFADDKSTVGLQAQADRDVPNDQVIAIVVAEEGGRDPAALASVVNRRMSAALATAREYPAVRARSAGYQTFPMYKDGRIESWRVSQQLRLESRDFALMAELLGKLQRELLVRGLSVGLSSETRRAAEDALVGEAIAAFRARAALVRQALNAAEYRIRHIDVGASGAPIRPMAQEGLRAMAAAPSVEPGTTQVAVSVTGTIELK
jgi:predicted secreted protein